VVVPHRKVRSLNKKGLLKYSDELTAVSNNWFRVVEAHADAAR